MENYFFHTNIYLSSKCVKIIFKTTVLINFILFKFVWEMKLYASYSVSCADCSEINFDFSDNIFGVQLKTFPKPCYFAQKNTGN